MSARRIWLAPVLMPAALATALLSSNSAGASSQQATSCTSQPQSATGTIGGSAVGISQPLAGKGPFTSADLNYSAFGIFNFMNASFSLWDPALHQPAAATVALRRATYGTTLGGASAHFSVGIPIVASAIFGVAETLSTRVVFEGFSGDGSFSRADAAVPNRFPAYRFSTSGGARTLLDPSGPPCGYTAQELSCPETEMFHVVQAVTGVTAPAAEDRAYVQVFRVAEPVLVDWVEVALVGPGPAQASIIDPHGVTVPAAPLPPALFTGSFSFGDLFPADVWLPMYSGSIPSTQTTPLLPGQDYWLHVSTSRLYERSLTGSEPKYFAARIGPLYSAVGSETQWTLRPSTALPFRLIGRRWASLSVPPPTPSPFSIRVMPNPSATGFTFHAAASVAVRSVEIVDLQGRRLVRLAMPAGSHEGWKWDGLDESGHKVPPGAYLVCAQSPDGARTSQRIIVER